MTDVLSIAVADTGLERRRAREGQAAILLAAVAWSTAGLAQRALEGKDKDEKQQTRAAQLAFLATQQDPGNADAWLTLGAAYEGMGKKQQAIESYRSCARRAASHPNVAQCKQLAGIKVEATPAGREE